MNNIKKRLLQLTLILSIFPFFTNGNSSKNQEKKESEKTLISYEILDSQDEVDVYFDEDVTYDILKNSLSSNLNLEDEYREYTKEFIDLVEIYFPNADLSIFNENIKLFKVKKITKEEMQKDSDRDAYYEIQTQTIYMHDEYKNESVKKYCYFHELWHMFNSLHIKIDNVIYHKTPTMFGYDAIAFDEGMTTLLTEKIYKSSVTSYTRQYDQIKILYNIYGEELIKIYLDSGVEGIEIFLGKQIGYTDSANLIIYMNEELNNKDANPIPTFEILMKLYFEHKKSDITDYEIMYEMLENLSYDSKIKKEILTIFYENIEPISIPDETFITFDCKNYYEANKLYFIECNENVYLINDEILIEYLYNGFIGNIYDEKKYIGLYQVKNKKSFIDYLKYHSEIFTYDELNNIIYVDSDLVKGDSYVKSK